MNLAPSTAGTVPALARAARGARGHHIGHWEVTRLLAAGRWTRVYRARPCSPLAPRAELGQQPLGDFVLKAVPPELAPDPLPRALLRREALVATLVRSPHLTTVLADHSASEEPHLVLPYLEGATLQQVRDAGHPLPIATACLIARQAASAIAALHETGWLHGDVAPANLLIAASGHTTVLDLGLARRIGSDECRGDLLVATTPGYAAPELLVSSGRLLPASDVYSLGLLLFELLAGRPPFGAASPIELIRLHRREAAPDVRLLRPTAPRELAELVRRMLVKEPLRRPAAGDIVRWLAEIEIAEL